MTLFQPSKGKLACRLEIIEALRLLPARLRDEVAGLSEEQLRFRPGEGQWSLKEVIGHLRDFAEIDHDRLVRMITQERPVLPGYEQEDLAREHNCQDADLHAVLEELASIRQETVHVLTELVDANWARTGRHLERGIFSIRQHVEHIIDHEALHLEHIRALKEQARGRAAAS
jgi:uncharacterized damage-inducible protein DinB